MDFPELSDEKVAKVIQEFKDLVLLSENGSYKLKEQAWEKYFTILGAFLINYSEKWLNEFLDLINEVLGSQKSFSKIPIKTVRSIKAYQILNITAAMHVMNLIEPESYDKFTWSLLKAISPTDAANCRGYISVYNASKNAHKDVARDITKQVIDKEFQDSIVNNERVIVKISEFALGSSFIAVSVLGLENEYLEKVGSLRDGKSDNEKTL